MKYCLAFTLSLAISLFLLVKSNEAATYIAFIHNYFQDGQTIRASVSGRIGDRPYEISYGKYERVTIVTDGPKRNLPRRRRRQRPVRCFVEWHSKIHNGPRHGSFVLFDGVNNIPSPEDTLQDRTGAFIYFWYVNETGAYIYNLDGTKKLKSRWL